MTENKTQKAAEAASDLSDLLGVKNILASALRQYQHNDCSGLLAAYDYDETQKIFLQLYRRIKNLEDTNERMIERSMMLRKHVPLHERMVFEDEWRKYINEI